MEEREEMSRRLNGHSRRWSLRPVPLLHSHAKTPLGSKYSGKRRLSYESMSWNCSSFNHK